MTTFLHIPKHDELPDNQIVVPNPDTKTLLSLDTCSRYPVGTPILIDGFEIRTHVAMLKPGWFKLRTPVNLTPTGVPAGHADLVVAASDDGKHEIVIHLRPGNSSFTATLTDYDL
jgi:hypothetical protein